MVFLLYIYISRNSVQSDYLKITLNIVGTKFSDFIIFITSKYYFGRKEIVCGMVLMDY